MIFARKNISTITIPTTETGQKVKPLRRAKIAKVPRAVTPERVLSAIPKTLFGKTVKASSINPKNGIIRCATVEYEQFLQENNPKRLKEAQFEADQFRC